MASSQTFALLADTLVDWFPDAARNGLRGLAALLAVADLALGSCLAFAQEKPVLDRFKDLKAIRAFSEVDVNLHRQDEEAASASGITEEGLEEFLRQQAAALFPGIALDDGNRASAESAMTNGALTCRVWIDDGRVPSVFQVRCQISTAAHRNIIEDASYGYGPPDQVSGIVRQQISYILGGFAGVLARLNSER